MLCERESLAWLDSMQTLCFSRAGIARGGLPSVARRPENSLIVRKRCECPLRELSYIIATRERGRRRPDKGWAERATLHIAFSSGSDSSSLEGIEDENVKERGE